MPYRQQTAGLRLSPIAAITITAVMILVRAPSIIAVLIRAAFEPGFPGIVAPGEILPGTRSCLCVGPAVIAVVIVISALLVIGLCA